MTAFSELRLSAPILQTLLSEGYNEPTPIQIKAIPVVLAGNDLLGIARTGSGKTAAFALPIIHRLTTDRMPARRKACRALVLAPTRELASQIAQSFRTYGRNSNLSVVVVFGGVGHVGQVRAMARGVDVLVATPGRLLDHVAEGSIDLSTTEVFVLDEADHMLDLGFLPAIRRIVSRLPARRQNLFFSATMPPDIGRLAGDLLRDPVHVSAAPAASPVESVTQRVLHVDTHNKRTLLVQLLADAAMSRTLVFTRTKRGADKVAQHLKAANIATAAIHGNKSQAQREHALAALRASKIRVLVATDIAARGIDIDQVTHVINYELPDVPESYVHRIGRTARAGAKGIAISLCDAEERGQLRDIERLTGQRITPEDHRADRGGTLEEPARPDNGSRSAGKPSRGRPGQRKPYSGKPRAGASDRRTGSGQRVTAEDRRSDRHPSVGEQPVRVHHVRSDRPNTNGDRPAQHKAHSGKPRAGAEAVASRNRSGRRRGWQSRAAARP